MKFDTGKNEYRRTEKVVHEPWLIQRCKSQEFNPGLRSSEYLKLDYMGSAEFEFGALPAWQREMHSKLNKLVIRLVEHNGQTLFVMAEDSQLDAYSQMVRDLIDGKIRTKEGVRLTQKETIYVGKNRKAMFDQPHAPFEFDCWWDITNGLAFARSIEVLNNLKTTITNSVRYMDEQKRK